MGSQKGKKGGINTFPGEEKKTRVLTHRSLVLQVGFVKKSHKKKEGDRFVGLGKITGLFLKNSKERLHCEVRCRDPANPYQKKKEQGK